MKVVTQEHTILTPISEGAEQELKLIEKCGRICYRSEDKITDDSYKKFIKSRMNERHDAILEHSFMSIHFLTDSQIATEILRHRHTSPMQESKRYCNYTLSKFGGEIGFVLPNGVELTDEYDPFEGSFASDWYMACEGSEISYFDAIRHGAKPEQAAKMLNHSVAVNLIISTNYREWRHIFKLRCDKAAHPMMQELMKNTLCDVYNQIPIVFDDIYEEVFGGVE